MNDSLAQWQDPETIQRALHKQSIAVVGMSSNELRASNFVGYYLKRNGYQVTPVNPREDEIYGLKCYASLTDIPHKIDVVDVFRDPAAVPAIAEEAVAIGAGFLWLQFGVISPQGVEIAEAGNVECIVDQCIKIEHARYLGRMHWLGFNSEQISAQRSPR
jgi:predicted CoA-binding protein